MIARQSLDTAVSEARKAIFAGVSATEWATPVLFVRDPAADLFDLRGPPRIPGPRSLVSAAAAVTVAGSGPVAVGGNVTITGGIAAGRDVTYPTPLPDEP